MTVTMLTKQYKDMRIDTEERELVRRSKTGDKEAFTRLTTEYSQRLYAYIYKMIGSHEDAEEILQETLCAAYSSIRRFRGDSLFSTWLYRIAINICCKALRKIGLSVFSTRVPIREEYDAEKGETGAVILKDSAPSALDQAIDNETRQKVRMAISRLPGRLAEVITLKELEDMTYAEISARLNIPTGTVMSRLHRARLKLTAALKQYGLKSE